MPSCEALNPKPILQCASAVLIVTVIAYLKPAVWPCAPSMRPCAVFLRHTAICRQRFFACNPKREALRRKHGALPTEGTLPCQDSRRLGLRQAPLPLLRVLSCMHMSCGSSLPSPPLGFLQGFGEGMVGVKTQCLYPIYRYTPIPPLDSARHAFCSAGS